MLAARSSAQGPPGALHSVGSSSHVALLSPCSRGARSSRLPVCTKGAPLLPGLGARASPLPTPGRCGTAGRVHALRVSPQVLLLPELGRKASSPTPLLNALLWPDAPARGVESVLFGATAPPSPPPLTSAAAPPLPPPPLAALAAPAPLAAPGSTLYAGEAGTATGGAGAALLVAWCCAAARPLSGGASLWRLMPRLPPGCTHSWYSPLVLRPEAPKSKTRPASRTTACRVSSPYTARTRPPLPPAQAHCIAQDKDALYIRLAQRKPRLTRCAREGHP